MPIATGEQATAADINAIIGAWNFNGATFGAGTTKYLGLGTQTASIGETEAYQFIAPAAFTLGDMYVQANTAPGAGQTAIITVRINGVDKSIVVTLSNAEVSGNDLVNTEAIVAGDRISVKVVSSGGAANIVAITVGMMSVHP